jgi:hypothetical protein
MALSSSQKTEARNVDVLAGPADVVSKHFPLALGAD